MRIAWAEFQKALYDKIRLDATIAGMITGVGDWLTPKTPLPYIAIREGSLQEWLVKDKDGFQITADIHIFTDNYGSRKAKQIADAVVNLLTSNALGMAVATNFMQIDKGRLSQSTVLLTEDDGRIIHIVLPILFRFRATVSN